MVGYALEGIQLFGLNGPLTAASVNFQCRYDLNIHVESATFDLTSAKVHHGLAGYGTLDRAFALSVFTDSDFSVPVGNAPVYIGSRLFTDIDFKTQAWCRLTIKIDNHPICIMQI